MITENRPVIDNVLAVQEEDTKCAMKTENE